MLRVIFAGTPRFASTILQALIDGPHHVVAVYTQPDRPAGRGQQLQHSAVKQLALQGGLTLHQPPSLREPTTQSTLAALKADIMVVAVYGSLLPQTILDTPPLGCINVHASLLPRWRGAAPIARALAAGDTVTGITLMQMVLALDAGPMLEKFTLSIDPTDTHASLSERLARLAAQQINHTLTRLESGLLTPVPQEANLVTYAEKLTKAEGLIDWQWAAIKLARYVRAFNPWPVMFSYLAGSLVRIWQAENLVTHIPAGLPGEIIALSAQGIDVSTGEGVLRLQAVQLAGKKSIHATTLIKTQHPLFYPGARFASS